MRASWWAIRRKTMRVDLHKTSLALAGRRHLRIARGPEVALVKLQMRRGLWILTMAAAVAGCARNRTAARGDSVSGFGTNSVITRPSTVTSGRIDWVNRKAGHIIASFPIGQVPPVDSRLSVYRNGLKVAELKVSLPQQNNLTAADIINGECQLGDEVRSY